MRKEYSVYADTDFDDRVIVQYREGYHTCTWIADLSELAARPVGAYYQVELGFDNALDLFTACVAALSYECDANHEWTVTAHEIACEEYPEACDYLPAEDDSESEWWSFYTASLDYDDRNIKWEPEEIINAKRALMEICYFTFAPNSVPDTAMLMSFGTSENDLAYDMACFHDRIFCSNVEDHVDQAFESVSGFLHDLGPWYQWYDNNL